jgi:transketolase
MTLRIPDFSPKTLRRHILNMAFAGQTVHSPCALSLVTILSVLYQGHLRFDPADPRSPSRDYLVLSKGHGVMALYACFYEIGWLKKEALERYNSDGSDLHGLAESKVPGIEAATGSLGHGFPVATGMALGLKRLARTQAKVICIVGDGEFNEGPNFESLLFAAHHHLDNLTLIIDANDFQAMGHTSAILGLEPLAAKLESFGFLTFDLDGHDPAALDQALRASHGGKPKAIVARTIKGKGVTFMEAQNKWHYTRLTAEDHAQALAESEASHA